MDFNYQGSMQRINRAALGSLAIAVAVAACNDSPQQQERSIQAPQRPRGAFIQQGKRKKLNLPNAAAEATVLYKDPVQGVKDATGACRFPNLGEMRIGLMATVGEWDTETCAGLLYYFKNSTVPYPKPSKTETIKMSNPQASGRTGAQSCALIANEAWTPGGGPIAYPDTIVVREAIVGFNWFTNTWTDTVARSKAEAYGGHVVATQLDGGCARINNASVSRTTWNLTGQYYTFFNGVDSGQVQLYEPQEVPVGAPYGVSFALFRSASKYYRTSSWNNCDHGHCRAPSASPSRASRRPIR